MTSLMEALRHRVVGTVEEVSADRITVLLEPEAPQATALSAGNPSGFPRIRGYLLIPNESGGTVGVISSVRVKRLPFPKRRGTQRDFGLVDLPFASRIVELTPLGTLKAAPKKARQAFDLHRGVDVFPSVGDPVVLADADQLQAIVEGESGSHSGRVLIGHCPTAGRSAVYVDPDKLFGRHLAVLGNTGAGKSCTVAGLLRWSLEAAASQRRAKGKDGAPNARFIILDPNGEYARAFRDLDVRLFTVEPVGTEASALQVPAWLWNGEEWAAFTGAAPGVQRPILFDALRRLRSGAGEPDGFETRVRGRVKRYRNRLRVLIVSGDHMQRGRREGVAASLTNMANDFHGLADDDHCPTGGLKDCLRAVGDAATEAEERARSTPKDSGFWHNDFAEGELQGVIERLDATAAVLGIDEEADALLDEGLPIPFPVEELPGFVDALAAGQSGRDVAQFVDTLSLRIRGLFQQDRLSSVVHPKGASEVKLDDWLNDYVGSNEAEQGPIAVIDLSLVPSEVVHVVVTVLARMVFEAVQRYRRETGHELPTTLVLEEAHTFVHRSLSADGASLAGQACARAFERIAREGRKFGLGLVLASQRPSEISPTVLSQCNTFLLHRIVNDRDQELVRRLVPDGLGSLLRDLPGLPSRRAFLLGWAAPAPVLVEVREVPEDERPHSPDPRFWSVWTGDEDREIDWAHLAAHWQGKHGGHQQGVDAEEGGGTGHNPEPAEEP